MLIFIEHSFAQNNESVLNYGMKAGLNRSFVSGLQTTILSEPYFINYTLEGKPKFGGAAGAFLNYRFKDALALQTDVMYSQQGSDLLFNNIQKDFHYKTQFNYQFVNISGQIKMYPLALTDVARNNQESFLYGFFVGVGPQWGLNVAPENIKYTSGGAGRLESFGSDLQQQQQLRNVLKGRTNFGASLAMGYEMDRTNWGLVFEVRYFAGVSDVLETQANSYNFIENKNRINYLQFTVGFDFSYFNKLPR